MQWPGRGLLARFRSKRPSPKSTPQKKEATVLPKVDGAGQSHDKQSAIDVVSATSIKQGPTPSLGSSLSGLRDKNVLGHSESAPSRLMQDFQASDHGAAAESHNVDATPYHDQSHERGEIVPMTSEEDVPQIILSRAETLPVFSQHSEHQSQQRSETEASQHSQFHSQHPPRTREESPSSMRSRSSSRASLTRSEASEDRDILPQTVSVALHITLDDEELHRPEDQVICWYEKGAFEVLADAAANCVKEKKDLLHTNLALADFYLRNGSCRVIGKKHRTRPRKLEEDLQIVEVLVIAICGFIHDYPYEPFRLDINWDYSTIFVKEEDGKDYKDVIRFEIHRKMEKNYEGKRYIPRTDLINILSPETSRLIITKDTSLSSEEKEDLLIKVRSRAENLQAVCVYAQLPMLCLKRLLDKEFHDKKRPRCESECPLSGPDANGEDWRVNFSEFLDKQASFFAYKFPKPTEPKDHEHISDDVVVPISYHPRGSILGEGAFSIVYEAQVDPVHHYFSEDRTQSFALKIFKERKKENKTFDRELEMLKQLKRYPHRHIVTHLFTWTQKESFYMLFPKAWGSLQEYMKEQPLRDPSRAVSPAGSFIKMPPDSSRKRPLLDANFVTWLLRQLLGLAEAVDHIHHLVGEAVQVPAALDIPGGGMSATKATGFHHDIKPGNILVFIDGEDHYGTFKIGDFGSGRLQTFRSGTQRSPYDNRPLGTPTYEGPDMFLLGTASRPYDIWSLGCVYLEILLWCFSPGPGGAENFTTERGEPTPDQPNYSCDEFWYRSVGQGSDKKASLKEAVKNRIRDLEDNHCKGRRAFEKLMTLVKRMFEIEAKKRITAPQLKGDVQAILKQAQADLDSDKDCYIRAADSDALPFDELPESSVPIPRTPTTVPTRRPSLNFGAQLSPLDAQSPVDPNRRRSDSFGQAQVASVTSNAGGHLSQSNAVQDDDIPDSLQGGPSQANQQGFVRPWADNANDVHGPVLPIPRSP